MSTYNICYLFFKEINMKEASGCLKLRYAPLDCKPRYAPITYDTFKIRTQLLRLQLCNLKNGDIMGCKTVLRDAINEVV